MQELKRVFTNRTFLFGLIAILIINAVLFYNEQKENDYGLDLSVANEIIWNTEMPDGTPRKLTNVDKLHELGWTHKVDLEEGVQLAYDWFRENVDGARL